MVDEYQDTNSVQYLWLRLLAQERKNICCVGDDDQSIYSWRGAEVDNILRFEKDFPGAKVIRLEQNYRSTPHILAAASGLIANNAGRLGKTLWTERGRRRKVRVIGVWDGPEEARRVGEEIEGLQRDGALARRQSPSSCAPSTRPASSRTASSRSASPYRIVGGFRFYERAEIRDALAYLRVIAQPADDLAFERIVNMPKRGLGDKALRRSTTTPAPTACRSPSPPRASLDSDELTGAGAPLARQSRGRLRPLARAWRPSCPIPSSPARCSTRAATPRCGRPTSAESRRPARKPRRAGPRDGGIRDARRLPRACQPGHGQRRAARRGQGHDHDHPRRQGPGVRHRVPAPAGRKACSPRSARSTKAAIASLEEERRLAYVAITRARRKCMILHAANRRIYGQWTSSHPQPLRRRAARRAYREREHACPAAKGCGAPTGPNAPIRSRTSGAAPTRPGLAARRDQRRITPRRRRVMPRSKPAPSASASRGTTCRRERVFHQKFGYGEIAEIEGNKLEIDFERAGRKRVMDSFVSLG